MRIVFSKLPLAGICAVLTSLHALAAADPQVAAATPAVATSTKGATAPTAKMESSTGPWVLYAPRYSEETVLLDAKGNEAHVWTSGAPGVQSARLNADGSILRLAKVPSVPQTFASARIEGGRLQRFSWDGRLLWDFPAATDDFIAYGDAITLPNGNVLTAVLEFKSREECEKAGRDPSLLTEQGMFVPGLMEFRPKDKHAGFIEWKWSLWDHLYQSRHPALANYQASGRKAGRADLGLLPNAKGPKWLIPKEIDYLPGEDLILVNMAGSGELWVIDHGTTTAEAAGETDGRRNGVGSLAHWKATDIDAPVILFSAEWNEDAVEQQNGRALISVLRWRGRGEGAFVEQVSLRLDTLEFGVSEVRHQEIVTKEQKRPVPAVVSRVKGTDQLVLGAPEAGQFLFAAAGKAAGERWTHQNERGKRAVFARPLAPGEVCCGSEVKEHTPSQTQDASVPKPASARKVEIAPISKPRGYAFTLPPLGPSK